MKNITNMGTLRSCVLILLMLVQLQTIAGKPFLTGLLCDLMCDDDDDVTTTTSSSNEDDYWDLFGLCTCGTRRPPGTRRGQGMPGNINMRLPPSANGMNFSMTNNNGLWSFNLDAGPNGPSGGMPLLVGPTTLTPTAAGGAVTTVTSTTAAPAGKK